MSYYVFFDEAAPVAKKFLAPLLPVKNGDGTWAPGEWFPALEGEPRPKNGYHVRPAGDLMNWWGDELYEVEVDGDVDSRYNVTTSPCRLVKRLEAWNKQAEHHLICDFVEHDILPVFEAKYPGDNRIRQGVEMHRRYADGEATLEEYKASRAMHSAAVSEAWPTMDAFVKNIDHEWQLQHLLETLGLSDAPRGL